ncbi:MAG: hypothetical protein MJ201_00165 [Mycoplasmoidaceae bacterium]|nr:hypothetical protein [Mycoplasmoidaceae bacterium]
MKELQKKKVFTTVNDLKNLNHIPNGKKKRIMTKNAERLSYYLDIYKNAFAELSSAKKAYNAAPAITNLEKYQIKKDATKRLALAENNVLTLKSKLSHYINLLLYDHNCAAGKKNITADELYAIVSAYENKEFTDNHFPARRLRVLTQNNSNLRRFQFELEVVNQILKGKFNYIDSRSKKTKDF